jgi:putative tryptophan/tyrosine transport system substrate-binding protein
MRRREFVSCLIAGLVARPRTGSAQTPNRRPLIAVLVYGSLAATSRLVFGFLRGMQELGYVEGRDVDIVYRYADGDMTRMPALADELIRLAPDVVVTTNTAGTLAVRQKTATLPVVSTVLTGPVGLGLVASHARPGGNVTGILVTVDTLPGKLLDLAREVVPGAKRIGMLVNPRNPSNTVQQRDTETAAAASGIKLVSREVRAPDELDAAFQAFAQASVDFVIVPADLMFLNERRRVAALALSARLPSIFSYREHVEDGGLLSYGINLVENYRGVAAYVSKILKGAKPADLPVQLPTKFELIVNLKTAKALGIELPPTLLARTDEVIE